MRAGPDRQISFNARPERIDGLLAFGILALAGVGMFMESFALLFDDNWLFGLHSIVSLNYSQNLPQWYYCILLLAAGGLCGLAFGLDEKSSRRRMRWILVQIMCVGLALKEFADLDVIAQRFFRLVWQAEFYEPLLHHHPHLAWAGSALAVLLVVMAAPGLHAGLRGMVSLSTPCQARLAMAVAVLAAAPHVSKPALPKVASSSALYAEIVRFASPGFDIIESSAMILGASLIMSAIFCEIFQFTSDASRPRLSVTFS